MRRPWAHAGPLHQGPRKASYASGGWMFEPHALLFIRMFPLGLKLFYYRTLPSNWISNSNFLRRFETAGTKYLNTPPSLCENAPFLTPLMILWET